VVASADLDKLERQAYRTGFGERLVITRLALGYETAIAAADHFKYNRDVWSAWEAGRRTPEIHKLPALIEALGVGAAWIVCGDMKAKEASPLLTKSIRDISATLEAAKGIHSER